MGTGETQRDADSQRSGYEVKTSATTAAEKAEAGPLHTWTAKGGREQRRARSHQEHFVGGSFAIGQVRGYWREGWEVDHLGRCDTDADEDLHAAP